MLVGSNGKVEIPAQMAIRSGDFKATAGAGNGSRSLDERGWLLSVSGDMLLLSSQITSILSTRKWWVY